MYEQEQVNAGFCPRCGALLRDGVCLSCGFASNSENYEGMNFETTNSYNVALGSTPYDVPVKKNNGKAITIFFICFGAAIILLVLLLFLVYETLSEFRESIVGAVESEQGIFNGMIESDETYEDSYDDFYYDFNEDEMLGETTEYGYTIDDYEVLGEGQYYMWFDNAIRKDLDYSVEIINDAVFSDDYSDALYIYYPTFAGDIPNVDGINNEFYKIYENKCDEFEKKQENDEAIDWMIDCYLTYMDENCASVVFVESESQTDGYFVQKIRCYNIDIKNGKLFDNSELVNVDDQFVSEFRERNSAQNGSSIGIEELDNQELKSLFEDNDARIVFFTPIGTEIGINDKTGWYTVTYKDIYEF